MKVLKDNGKLVVALLDGKRRVRVGTKQSAGKEKVGRQGADATSIFSLFASNSIVVFKC